MNPFNPACQILKDSERLRIRHGKLMVEDKRVRDNANFLSRLFTRGQYNQEATLKKMHAAYQKTINDKESFSENFIQNYESLIHRAEEHNNRHSNSCFSFLFKINVKSFKNNLEEIKAKQTPIQNPPEVLLNWWGEATPDEEILLIPEFGELGCIRARDLLNLINPALKINDADNTASSQAAIFKTIGLVTVQDFMDKGLTSREKFNTYLNENGKTLTSLILINHPALVTR